MGSLEEIKQLASLCLADESQFVVDVILSSRRSSGKLLVVIDGDNGVSIDDCAEVSRKLSKALDEKEWMGNRYFLEVSTPGLDQPLRLTRQYRKNIGRSIKVKTGDENIEGVLDRVSDAGIVLIQTQGEGKKKEIREVSVLFDAIEKAFVLISFK